jgi:Concanavalin A-like lectin/glucanases superfamily
MNRSSCLASLLLSAALLPFANALVSAQHGAAAYQVLPPEYGPFSGHFMAGGEGLEKPVPESDPLLKATTPWTMTAWVEMPMVPAKPMLIAGVGNAMDEELRFFAVMNGRLALCFGKDNVLTASAPLAQRQWHFLAATFDGQIAHLYSDGAEVAKGPLIYGRVAPMISMAPAESGLPGTAPFGGRIALLTLMRAVMSDAEITATAKQQPDFSLIAFEEGSKPWPVQTRGQAGYRAPQDPATLPRSGAPFSQPKAGPEPPAKTTLRKDSDGAWTLSGGWKLTPAPKVTATPEEISKPGFHAEGWWAATVPGTVLTTMVDRIRLIHSLDGTRYYSPSSNEVNLQGSGPYSYQEPADYYAMLNHGFSVETGTPSLPTREWFTRWIPEADHWPVSDDWAYHDWHQAGNGDVNPFDEHMEVMFGAATNLDDYVRKAQMMNYVDHRAIFEGMNAHLWSPNSGRMLWMTQPAWPSTMWEIFTSDYDTQASYYGVKKACEPVHVQLDLSNDTVAVTNTTLEARSGLKLTARVYSLDNKLLLSKDAVVNAAADAMTPAFPLALAPLMGDGVVLVRLELRGADGQLVSDNFY